MDLLARTDDEGNEQVDDDDVNEFADLITYIDDEADIDVDDE